MTGANITVISLLKTIGNNIKLRKNVFKKISENIMVHNYVTAQILRVNMVIHSM